MNTIDRSLNELREMDMLADQTSVIHSLHPLIKLLITVAYIITVVSFRKYDLSRLFVMVLFPIVAFQISGIPVSTCFYKLRVVLPLVCAVGLFNPFFDRQILFYLASVPISGGVISMSTLMLKGILCLMASFLLAATARIDAICSALRILHVPSMIVTLLLLTFRYVSLMIEEAGIMSQAYSLRAPGQKGIHYKAWGSFLGQLLLRSMDRAQELYSSMLLRGFRGEFPYSGTEMPKLKEWGCLAASISLFILLRNTNITALLGTMLVSSF